MRHKYLNDIGIKSTDTCVFSTTERESLKRASRAMRMKKQRKKYGFDERETWELGYTLITWLYSHLMMYKDVSICDLEYHKFDIPVLRDIPAENRPYVREGLAEKFQEEVTETHSEGEAIEIALEYMREFLKEEKDFFDFDKSYENDVRKQECAACALRIVAKIFPSLWW